jgi:RES domain-containing protein
VLGDIVRAAGHVGIVFPSGANPCGSNLVIYPDLLPPDQSNRVFDADHRLPKDQASWA